MNLLYPIRRAAQLYPENIASYQGDRSINWRDLWTRVRQSATFLRETGCTRLAVLMLNRHEYLELYHSTLVASVWIVPLNIRWSPQDFIFAINDSEADTIVVDETFAKLVPALKANCPGLRHFLYAGDGPAPD